MATPQDFTKTMQDMMAAFTPNAGAMQDMFKTPAALGEKMSRVVLEAAEKSTELSARWTKATLAGMGEITTAKTDPAEYSKAYANFASSAAENATEHMMAFAEIAKKVQMETVELMLSAGKDFSEDASAAMTKVTSEATSAVQKAMSAGK